MVWRVPGRQPRGLRSKSRLAASLLLRVLPPPGPVSGGAAPTQVQVERQLEFVPAAPRLAPDARRLTEGWPASSRDLSEVTTQAPGYVTIKQHPALARPSLTRDACIFRGVDAQFQAGVRLFSCVNA